ncbi:hypothetical protein DFP72DRAFT_839850 [Ephemerocybe angulata]|uniref:Uncharacterized protein n=1 Tax=Ephemerocybe angulata TaxID=980116 RepID=A0A8H6IJ58_9AGAR|nr:hypothetical protein DFP72DRAFT_839850 [Tulosesus angulatus]
MDSDASVSFERQIHYAIWWWTLMGQVLYRTRFRTRKSSKTIPGISVVKRSQQRCTLPTQTAWTSLLKPLRGPAPSWIQDKSKKITNNECYAESTATRRVGRRDDAAPQKRKYCVSAGGPELQAAVPHRLTRTD